MIVNTRIMRDISGDKLGVLLCYNASDLVTAKQYSAVHLTINESVSP